MSQRLEKLKPSKGSMIVLILAVSLIVGIALPRKEDPEVQKPVSFQMDSQWEAVVKRAEVSVGSQVAPGDTVLVLIDPRLEAEVLRLENRLKLAELETMEAVAEPGMLGMIGSLPRVIWEKPEPEENTLTIASKETVQHRSAMKVAKRDVSKFENTLREVESNLAKAESKIALVNTDVGLHESEVAAAQNHFDQSHKELAKLQRLYDLGAIPKKQLDESNAIADSAGVGLADAKQKLAESVASQEILEKEAVELRARVAMAKEDLAEASKVDEAVIEEPPSPIQAKAQPAPSKVLKPVKKVVYGTAPSGFAPVKVNLIEDETPTEAKEIEIIRTKLLGLKAKRELLRVRALRAGRVRWIAEPGSEVKVGSPLIEIEY